MTPTFGHDAATANEPIGVWVPIDDLVPWPDNPRRNDGAVEAVAASLDRFGWTNPILAQASTLMVVAGHTRLKAARKRGRTLVPVRWLDLTDAEAKAVAVADNKLGELAEWDDAKLAQVLAEVRAEVDVAVLGLSDDEVARLTRGVDAPPQPKDPPAPPAPTTSRYVVVVECRDEGHQLGVLGDLTAQGLVCRTLVM